MDETNQVTKSHKLAQKDFGSSGPILTCGLGIICPSTEVLADTVLLDVAALLLFAHTLRPAVRVVTTGIKDCSL